MADLLPYVPNDPTGPRDLLWWSRGPVASGGSRVVLGHAGRITEINGKLVWLRWITGLWHYAAATRAPVDFVPKVKVSHHLYAMALWSIVSLLWMIRMRRCWAE